MNPPRSHNPTSPSYVPAASTRIKRTKRSSQRIRSFLRIQLQCQVTPSKRQKSRLSGCDEVTGQSPNRSQENAACSSVREALFMKIRGHLYAITHEAVPPGYYAGALSVSCVAYDFKLLCVASSPPASLTRIAIALRAVTEGVYTLFTHAPQA